VRPELSVLVFDPQAQVGKGQGVLDVGRRGAADRRRRRARHRDLLARLGLARARPWTFEDVQGPAVLRLYRARVSEHWVLDPERRPDQRTRVRP
jgi:hypothetical protein